MAPPVFDQIRNVQNFEVPLRVSASLRELSLGHASVELPPRKYSLDQVARLQSLWHGPSDGYVYKVSDTSGAVRGFAWQDALMSALSDDEDGEFEMPDLGAPNDLPEPGTPWHLLEETPCFFTIDSLQAEDADELMAETREVVVLDAFGDDDEVRVQVRVRGDDSVWWVNLSDLKRCSTDSETRTR